MGQVIPRRAYRMSIPLTGSGEILDPAEIFGGSLWAWYDASQGVSEAAGLVSSWEDMTEADRDLTTIAASPIWSATSANGAPGVSTDSSLESALQRIGSDVSLAGVTQFSCFAVLSMSSGANAFGLAVCYRKDNASGAGDLGGSQTIGRWSSDATIYVKGGAHQQTGITYNRLYHIGVVCNDAGPVRRCWFGDLQGGVPMSDVGGDTNANSLAGSASAEFRLGTNFASQGWSGVVGEVLIITGAIPSSDQIALLSAYNINKYGP